MPPKRKKAKGLEASSSQPEHIRPSTSTALERRSVRQNDCGFLKLPVEILTTHLLEYFPNIPVGIPDEMKMCGALLPQIVLERRKVLCALAQTCKRFRDIFLPLQWQSLDLCTYSVGPNVNTGPWYLIMARMTERLSEGLVKTPALASYVRVVNVAFTRCSPKTVYPALARCLRALHNLHTLQVTHAHSQITSFIKNGFEGFTFPQIRTVFLPPQVHNFLLSCPGVRRVVCDGYGDSQKLLAPIIKKCGSLERLEGVDFESMASLKRLLKSAAASNLKYLNLRLALMDEAKINSLAGFKQLAELELISGDPSASEAFQRNRAIVDAVKKVLSKSSAPKRILKISSRNYKLYKWYHTGQGYMDDETSSYNRERAQSCWATVIEI
ncbi:hypothetical protein V5O48_009721 [Marasmius crinis-equi]|uniref:F-box domain-containing protein n=1 Tax=Marasmius crinis-equi TaxID=585013 RepID=A0ABR3FAE4_9AGAR